MTMTQCAQDLTHAEACNAFRAFADECGPNVEVYVHMCCGHHDGAADPLTAAIYPQGIIAGGQTLHVKAATYTDLLAAARAKWADYGDTHALKTIRDMALKIISITADDGACSEFALCKAFSPAEVKAYGDRACDEATRIAGNGPFRIVRGASASEAA